MRGMHPHAELITRFYDAFSRCDGDAMAACYHPDVRFSDPVFPDLQGARAGAMWQMLTERAEDLVVVASDIQADDTSGRAHWEADYTFSTTGNLVHNVIDATFEFKDGLIVKHTDVFDFHAWAKQALGFTGLLLGWTGFLQNKVRATAGGQHGRYCEKRGIL